MSQINVSENNKQHVETCLDLARLKIAKSQHLTKLCFYHGFIIRSRSGLQLFISVTVSYLFLSHLSWGKSGGVYML